METQTFINGARRELARQLPDTNKMNMHQRRSTGISTASVTQVNALLERLVFRATRKTKAGHLG